MGSDTRQGPSGHDPCNFVVETGPDCPPCPQHAAGLWRSPLTGADHPLCALHGALMTRMARWAQVVAVSPLA